MSARSFPFFRRTPPGVTARLTTPVPWRPLTDEEWEQVMHFMVYVHPGPGRPTINGARRSLDACFHAACSGRPWAELSPHYGRPNSVARLFRRWGHLGLWKMMLKFVAKERRGLEAVQYFVCRAFRRAWRLHGLAGLTLARRLGMDSASRGPSWYLMDQNLSQYLHQALWPRLRGEMTGPHLGFHLGMLKRIHTLCMGRRTLPAWARFDLMEQPGNHDGALYWRYIARALAGGPLLPRDRGCVLLGT